LQFSTNTQNRYLQAEQALVNIIANNAVASHRQTVTRTIDLHIGILKEVVKKAVPDNNMQDKKQGAAIQKNREAANSGNT